MHSHRRTDRPDSLGRELIVLAVVIGMLAVALVGGTLVLALGSVRYILVSVRHLVAQGGRLSLRRSQTRTTS